MSAIMLYSILLSVFCTSQISPSNPGFTIVSHSIVDLQDPNIAVSKDGTKGSQLETCLFPRLVEKNQYRCIKPT